VKQFFTVLSMLFLLLISFAISASSQEQSRDVVYLKNGSVVNGEIIEQVPNKSIKIKNTDGDILIYSFDEIEKIEKQKISQDVPVVQYKDRLGLNIGSGAGFESAPVAKLTDGSEASISFGGGIIVQLQYGHEFNKNFDVAIDIGGQFSSLDKSVNNGSMTFNRTVLSLTPFYVLPIAGGDKFRLKFGAGVDVLYNAELNFDLSQISGGVKDDWKYNSTFGEHVSVIFEMNLPQRFSISAGLKWQNANYTFNSGSKSYPTSNNLKSPNGSGIDILIGGYYHFDWIE
jgi:hypothetical protein